MEPSNSAELAAVLELAGRLEDRDDKSAVSEILELSSRITEQEAGCSAVAALKNNGRILEAAQFASRFEDHGGQLPDELSARSLNESLVSESAAVEAFDRGKPVDFKRLSFRQRRNPSRVWPHRPEFARWMRLSKSDGITVRRLFRTHQLRWDEISSARVDEHEDYFAYGYSRIRYIRRVLVIEANGKPELLVDITANRPEFANVEVIETIIERIVPITQGERHDLPENSVLRRNLRTMTAIVVFAAIVVLIDRLA